MQSASPLRFLISGASGLVGSSLSTFLISQGHSVTALKRNSSGKKNTWDGKKVCNVDFSEFDCFVHLAGENIGNTRWSAKRKKEIIESRIQGTTLVAEKISACPTPPYVISASAIGFYGSSFEEKTEKSQKGEGFLSDVVFSWENAWSKAQEKNVKVCMLRLGVVLSPQDGALKKMLLPFSLGLGAIAGSGKQFMSWVALEDVHRCVHFLSEIRSVTGPVNVCSPDVVTNEFFSKTLARTLKRPCFLFAPKFMLILLFGEMAKETILSSNRINSSLLQKLGFRFSCDELQSYFCQVFKKFNT